MKKINGRPLKYDIEILEEALRLYETTDMGYRKIANKLNIEWTKVAYYVKKNKKVVEEID